MTVEEAASYCGVTQETIINRIAGRTQPKIYAKKQGRGKTAAYIIDVAKSVDGLVGKRDSGRKKTKL